MARQVIFRSCHNCSTHTLGCSLVALWSLGPLLKGLIFKVAQCLSMFLQQKSWQSSEIGQDWTSAVLCLATELHLHLSETFARRWILQVTFQSHALKFRLSIRIQVITACSFVCGELSVATWLGLITWVYVKCWYGSDNTVISMIVGHLLYLTYTNEKVHISSTNNARTRQYHILTLCIYKVITWITSRPFNTSTIICNEKNMEKLE